MSDTTANSSWRQPRGAADAAVGALNGSGAAMGPRMRASTTSAGGVENPSTPASSSDYRQLPEYTSSALDSTSRPARNGVPSPPNGLSTPQTLVADDNGGSQQQGARARSQTEPTVRSPSILISEKNSDVPDNHAGGGGGGGRRLSNVVEGEEEVGGLRTPESSGGRPIPTPANIAGDSSTPSQSPTPTPTKNSPGAQENTSRDDQPAVIVSNPTSPASSSIKIAATPSGGRPRSQSRVSAKSQSTLSPRVVSGGGRDRSGSRASQLSGTSTLTAKSQTRLQPDCVREKRVAEWKKHFRVNDGGISSSNMAKTFSGSNIGEGSQESEPERLICTHGCALVLDIMIHGRIYISNQTVGFRSNIVGWVTKRHFSLKEIERIEMRSVAGFIPNAMAIVHGGGKESLFTTLGNRDHTMNNLLAVWADASPDAYAAFISTNPELPVRPPVGGEGDGESDGDEDDDGDDGEGHDGETFDVGRGATYADTEDFEKVALTTTLPTTPDRVYALLYHDDPFIKSVWESQGFRDIKLSEWSQEVVQDSSTGEPKRKMTRKAAYSKPIGGNIGSTTVESEEEIIHPSGQDKWFGVVGITRTPNIPSGKSFSTKSKTVFTWTADGRTKMHCSYQIEWTGKSMLKGMINGQAENGQKEWNKLLATKLKEYVLQHPEEFPVPKGKGGVDEDEGVGDGDNESQVVDAVRVTTADGQIERSSTSSNAIVNKTFAWLQEDYIRAALAIALVFLAILHLTLAVVGLVSEQTVKIPLSQFESLEPDVKAKLMQSSAAAAATTVARQSVRAVGDGEFGRYDQL